MKEEEKMSEKTSLKKDQLGFLEVIALSVAILAPTFASSMNFGMIASNAGYSVSLVFIISVIALLLVAVSFVKFGREFVSAGSAYTYIEAGLGKGFGTISGWALILTYAAWTCGCSSAFGYLFGDFIQQLTGANIPWIVFTLIALFAIWYITYYDVKISTRIMLFIEIFSVILVIIVAVVVLVRVGSTTGLSAAPFKVTPGYPVTGIGAGMVAAILSFGGFEGAASLGEESRNPKKYIPIAILSTVIFAGIIYIVVSFAEINGFGATEDGLKAFTSSGSTVVDLSNKFLGPVFTAVITFAISISCISWAMTAKRPQSSEKCMKSTIRRMLPIISSLL
jgi:amino acid transporter